MDGRVESKLDIGSKQSSTSSFSGITRRLSMKIAKIRNVHTDTNTVDLEWLWPVRGGADKIVFGSPYVGFRSGIRFVPEVGSIVIVGYAFNQMVMLSYLLPSDYQKLVDGTEDADGNPAKIRQLGVGEISITSSSDSEIYLHDKVEIRDQNLNTIIIDPADSSITLDSNIAVITNDAGIMTMGSVVRSGEPVTSDGLPVNSLNGGSVLTELSINIDKFSEATILNGESNPMLASITIGTLVDNAGLIVKNQSNSNIILNADFNSIASIKIDESGSININDGNALKPTDIPAIVNPLLETVTGTLFVNQSRQRAAREGDRVVIPFTTPTQSLKDHPDLASKATFNMAQLQQIATMIMTPMGPCIGFIPSVADTRLVGAITQGSDSLFIGSLNKDNEKAETLDNSL